MEKNRAFLLLLVCFALFQSSFCNVSLDDLASQTRETAYAVDPSLDEMFEGDSFTQSMLESNKASSNGISRESIQETNS